jgi:DNA-binding NtrC family response regulator
VSHVPTIIVIDDHTGLQGLLCQILLDAGYSVRTAAHPTHALRLLREKTPAIVLMDWRHDGMSPRELIDAAQAQFEGVKFVVTTTHHEEAEAADDLGVRHILQKPYNVDELIEAVSQCAAGIIRPMRTTGSSSMLPAASAS